MNKIYKILIGVSIVLLLLLGVLFTVKSILSMDIDDIPLFIPSQSIIDSPNEEVSCSSYDIPDKFRETYGNSQINSLEDNCEIGGGIWREFNNEMGCYWNPDSGSTFDCNAQPIIGLGNYCEDDLLANWECNLNIAYVGCLCNKAKPSTWVEEEEEIPEQRIEKIQTQDRNRLNQLTNLEFSFDETKVIANGLEEKKFLNMFKVQRQATYEINNNGDIIKVKRFSDFLFR